jgi:hypothetical protein
MSNSNSNRLQEFVEGWRVVGLLAGVACSNKPRVTLPLPSGAFYLLGWWWEAEHMLIPALIEEERVAKELEDAFAVSSQELEFSEWLISRVGGGVGSSNSKYPLSASLKSIVVPSFSNLNDARYEWAAAGHTNLTKTTFPSGSDVGHWEWGCFRIGVDTPPHPLRKWILKLLMGVTYTPLTPKLPKSSLRSPLGLLKSYLGSIKPKPMQIVLMSSASLTTSLKCSEATTS